MQLKLQRTQRTGGLVASTILFCLDVRADYSPEEKSNINRYKLGGQSIYNSRAAQKHFEAAGAHLDRTQEGPVGNRVAGLARGAMSMALAKMQLNISIASLGRGHHIECKDLEELLESEDTIRTACKNLTRYLEVASTFDGSEVVVEYVNGEEKVHVAQSAPPLLEYETKPADAAIIDAEFAPVPNPQFAEFGKDFAVFRDAMKNRWMALEGKILAYASGRGWPVTDIQVRAAACVLGLLALIILYEIL
jgi:hypothetical protein